MDANAVSDPILIAIISVLITIAGVLLAAVVHQHRTEVRDIKSRIKTHETDIKTLHHRQTKHLEEYHAVKATG